MRKAYIIIIAFLITSCSSVKKQEKVVNIEEPLEIKVPGKYQASATKEFDLIHTKLEIKPLWTEQKLAGKATLTLKPHYYPQKELTLDAKGFDIHEIKLLTDGNEQPLNYEYDSLKIKIDLGKTFTRNDKVKVFIDYTADPDAIKTGGSSAISSNQGLYFIDPMDTIPGKPKEMWTQGETEASSRWFPTIDHPNQKTTEEIYITVDTSFVTLSNGTLEYSILNDDGTRMDYWKQDKPHAPYLFMVAVGRYAVVKDKWRDSLEVSYYVEPKYKKYAHQIFGNTPEMIDFYSKRLGYKFPWDKYSQVVVRDFVSGAMENTSATVILEDIQQTPREMLDKNYDGLIAHELFHQWFGDLVTCESWANISLNESFATYGEYLWEEHKNGREAADYKWEKYLEAYLVEAQSKQEPLIQFYYDDPEDLFDRHRYQKGALILHMLRKYLGDDAFFDGLKNYLHHRAFKAAEFQHLRLAFEETTGEDLNWFFNEWYTKPGHPILKVDYEYDDANNEMRVIMTQKQDLETTPLYKLPLAIDVYQEGKKERHQFTIKSQVDTFSFYAYKRPKLINFDAEKELLAVKEQTKPIGEWEFEFYHAPLYMDKIESIEGFASYLDSLTNDHVFNFLKDVVNDTFWAIRTKGINIVESIRNDELKNMFKPLLIEIAHDDSVAAVRALAYEALGNFKDENLGKAIAKGLNDSSYNVIKESLIAIGKTDARNALREASRFEDSEKDEILFAVGLIYTDHANKDKNQYLRKLTLSKISSVYRYSLFRQYVDYLERQSPEFLSENLDMFDKMGNRASAKWEYFVIYKTARETKDYFEKSVIGDKKELSEFEQNTLDKLDGIIDNMAKLGDIDSITQNYINLDN